MTYGYNLRLLAIILQRLSFLKFDGSHVFTTTCSPNARLFLASMVEEL